MLPYLGWAYGGGGARGENEDWMGGKGGGLTHETHQTAPSCLGMC